MGFEWGDESSSEDWEWMATTSNRMKGSQGPLTE